MKRLLLLSLISCACLLPLFAQIQNVRIEGTVQDAAAAVIPGAKLSIVNLRTHAKLDAESDASGFFFFPSLQPGFYTLTAEASGFRTAIVTSIEVTVGVTLRQDV